MGIIKRSKIILLSSWNTSKALNKSIGDNEIFLFLDILFSKLLLGANTEDYCAMEFYRKSWRERNRFVTARRNFVFFFHKFYDKNAVDIFDNKDKFNKKFARFIHHEWIFSNDVSTEDIRNFCIKHHHVIVKPTGGCEGIGVYKLDAESKDEIDKLITAVEKNGEKFMIEQLIHSHVKISILNPPSVNTIRVETCIDYKGDVHVTNSIIIIGTTDSCVNNTHSGGIMCHVNWETGVIDSLGRNPAGDKYFKHPSSGIILPGYKIPFWKELETYVKELALVVPAARLIGWDIVVTDDGFDVIEGNVRPGHCTQICDGVGRWELLKAMI